MQNRIAEVMKNVRDCSGKLLKFRNKLCSLRSYQLTSGQHNVHILNMEFHLLTFWQRHCVYLSWH